MKLKVDDKVIILAGKHKGEIGKVLSTNKDKNQVTVEGINGGVKNIKPSFANPRGSKVEFNRPINASNVAIVGPDGKKPARVGYEIDSKGSKKRVYRNAGGKEIK